MNFAKQKPPRLSILIRSDAALLADLLLLKDGRASST